MRIIALENKGSEKRGKGYYETEDNHIKKGENNGK